jgi:adenylate kinase family enzyme
LKIDAYYFALPHQTPASIYVAMPTPRLLQQYHIFLASPGDVGAERTQVRNFFDDFNRSVAHVWNVRFEVVDWENYSSTGIGRPQELITQQTLEKYRDSLALVIGIMGQRFGCPSGKAESGTEEEFNWALESHKTSGFPEIKWFFRKFEKIEVPEDPDDAEAALEQWKKVRAFRKRLSDLTNPVFFAEYSSEKHFTEILQRDLHRWLSDAERPWAKDIASGLGVGTGNTKHRVEFDDARYRTAILKRYEHLNFEMLDMTGAYYAVRLWSVFVPQAVRECHEFNPRLLEISKEHQLRLLNTGELCSQEIEDAQQEAARRRQAYFNQPRQPVLDVVEVALRNSLGQSGQKPGRLRHVR